MYLHPRFLPGQTVADRDVWSYFDDMEEAAAWQSMLRSLFRDRHVVDHPVVAERWAAQGFFPAAAAVWLDKMDSVEFPVFDCRHGGAGTRLAHHAGRCADELYRVDHELMAKCVAQVFSSTGALPHSTEVRCVADALANSDASKQQLATTVRSIALVALEAA